MAQRFLLAQGSILIDVPPQYTSAFLGLAADERAAVSDHFRFALMGGDAEEQEELSEQLHLSEFRAPIPVDAQAQPELDDVNAVANRVLAAYNDRAEDFGLTFAEVSDSDPPTCVRYVYNPETGQWYAVYNWNLTVVAGIAAGPDFNWLPLAEAQEQGDYALPLELGFLLSGNGIAVDLAYHVTVTLTAE